MIKSIFSYVDEENSKLSIFVMALLVVFFIWLASSNSFQFIKHESLVEVFPGPSSLWFNRGDTGIVSINKNEVRLSLSNSNPSSVYKRFYLKDSIDIDNRFLEIEAIIYSHHLKEIDNDSLSRFSYVTQTEKSLLMVWFGFEENERVRILRLKELNEYDYYNEIIEIVRIPEEAEYVTFELLVRQSNVDFAIHNIRIDQLNRSSSYNLVKNIGLVVLGLLFTILLYKFRVNFKSKYLIITLLTGTIFSLALVSPGSIFLYANDLIVNFFPTEVLVNRSIFSFWVYIFAHVFTFTFMTWIFLYNDNYQNIKLTNKLCSIVIFALFTEAIQGHSVERTPSFEDLCWDLLGVSFGYILWLMTKRYRTT